MCDFTRLILFHWCQRMNLNLMSLNLMSLNLVSVG